MKEENESDVSLYSTVEKAVRKYCKEHGDIMFEANFLRKVSSVDEFFEYLIEQGFNPEQHEVKSFYPVSYFVAKNRPEAPVISIERSCDFMHVCDFLIYKNLEDKLFEFVKN